MATLASTLVGTFTASMGLYDRVSDRREQHKQRKRDTKQDGDIKQLKEDFEKAQERAENRQREIDRLKSGGGEGGVGQGGGGGQGGGRRNDDVGFVLSRDAAMIQRMYDDGFGRYGSRFAQGDGMFHANSGVISTNHTQQPSRKINSKLKSSPFSKPSSTFSKTLSTTTANSHAPTKPSSLPLPTPLARAHWTPCTKHNSGCPQVTQSVPPRHHDRYRHLLAAHRRLSWTLEISYSVATAWTYNMHVTSHYPLTLHPVVHANVPPVA
jgi:hypothetical protein